jgi:hypothetical protein
VETGKCTSNCSTGTLIWENTVSVKFKRQSSVPDPYGFGPLGSGSGIICTGSNPDLDSDPSRSSSKKIKKNLDLNYLLVAFFALLSLKTDVNVPTVCNKEKSKIKQYFLLRS